MSREIRRVPVGWKHPVEANPYYEQQEIQRIRLGRPPSLLLKPGEMFKPLYGPSYSVAVAEWDREKAEWDAGTHSHLAFLMEFYSRDGFVDRDGVRQPPKPYTVRGLDGETVVRQFFPRR